MPRKRRKKHWSYNAGERGRNWVRAYCQARDGKYYLEWREDGRRRAVLLKHLSTAEQAKQKADELAAKFAALEERPDIISISELMDRYLKEVTPTKKSEELRAYERRATRLWRAFFDTQPEVGRRSSRHAGSLDRIDWDRFITARRGGLIPGRNCVRDRAVQRDLKHLMKVLNWSVGAHLLSVSPWRTEIRRTQRWSVPKEKNPRRPSMTAELRAGLIEHSVGWQLPAMMVLERETRRRNNSIRQLRWSDIDQDTWTVRWRSESDKVGREGVTPLTTTAIQVLKGLPSRGIGDTPVFPSARDANEPTSSRTSVSWLYQAKQRWLKATAEEDRDALTEALRGVGFHAELRAGVRDPEFRSLSPKVQEEFAGKTYQMLKSTYDEVTVSDMRDEGEGLGIPGAAEKTG